MIDHSLLLIFPAAMAFAAAMDMLTMTIPNRVSLLLIGGFFVAALVAGLSMEQVLMHLAAGLVVFLICFAMFAAGLFGGGDAKLLAASSLWIGFDQLLPYITAITLFGFVLGLLMLVARSYFPEGSVRAPRWVMRLQARETGMPYGLAIAAAALWVYPSTQFFAGLSV